VTRRRLTLLAALVALLPASACADGAVIYRERCAVCHGSEGRGDGPAAGLLAPGPRDFTLGRYKFRSTPTGSLPTLADVERTVARGLPGTSMPGYADLLSPEEIETVARHVLALAPPGVRRSAPVAVDGPAHGDGAALYARAGCVACHGPDGRGAIGRAPTRLDEPWTFRGGGDEASIARRILTGIDGGGMPASAGRLDAGEALAVARFVLRLARAPIWAEPDAARVRTGGVATDPVARGRYLVRAMQCPLCHTPISTETGAYDMRFFLAGGMRVVAYPWGVWYSRNLTSDTATGLGAWSAEEIVAAVTLGIVRDGRRLDPMAMPWPWFSRLTPADARAVAAYLTSLPPVTNAVPAQERIALPERVGGTLLAALGAEAAVAFWGGNAALEPALRDGIPVPHTHRLAATIIGWGTLALGVGLGALGWRRGRRRRLWLAGAATALAAWLALGVWPPLALLSPELTTRWLLLGTPQLPPTLAAAERALAERGQYLATIAPCGLCHTPVSAFAGFLTNRTLAGGMEARWRVYGQATSSNLTPHDHGIARADDAAVLRAMRSGVGIDGRMMHWQAMPWDIISNWSEEDQRAMLAYLRALPAVAGRVGPPRRPRPGDPPADTFLFGDAARR